MESVLDNSALAFIVEDIFSYLNCHELSICRMVCKSWKDLIDNCRLWWLWKMRKIRSDSIHFLIWTEAFDYFESVKNVYKIQEFVDICESIRTQNLRKGPIYLAAENGHLNLLRLLLPSALDFDNSLESKTPFIIACRNGKNQIVEFLLNQNQKRINYNATDNIGNSAFMNACKYGNIEVIQTLMKSSESKGIKLNTANHNGRTALHIACMIESNSTEGTIYLLQNLKFTLIEINAIDQRGWTAFHFACKIGKLDVVEEFLSMTRLDLDFDLPLSDGRTPFHLACIEGHEKIVQLFLNNPNIDLNARDYKGCTAFHYACRTGQIEIVEILAANPDLIDVNAADNEGTTALHCACTLGDQDMVELLLNKSEEIGLNIQAKNSHGYTAFELAQIYMKIWRLKGNTKVLKLFDP